MANDLTARLDRLAQRFRRRFLRERKLPLALGPFYLRKVFDLVRPQLVWDVGANAGQYASLLRHEVGYMGPICSVEPIPEVAADLRRLAQADGAWRVVEAALGRVNGQATFNVMAGSEFSSLQRPAQPFEGRFHGQHRVVREVEVQVRRLEDLAAETGPLPSSMFLKVDTQGTELDVLAGAGRLLGAIGGIQTELSLSPLYVGAPPMERTLEAVHGMGYSLAAVFANNEGHFPRLLELDAVFVRNDLLPELA